MDDMDVQMTTINEVKREPDGPGRLSFAERADVLQGISVGFLQRMAHQKVKDLETIRGGTLSEAKVITPTLLGEGKLSNILYFNKLNAAEGYAVVGSWSIRLMTDLLAKEIPPGGTFSEGMGIANKNQNDEVSDGGHIALVILSLYALFIELRRNTGLEDNQVPQMRVIIASVIRLGSGAYAAMYALLNEYAPREAKMDRFARG